MKHNFANSPEETSADFTAAHLAIHKEFEDKAIAVLRKDDPKMSELNAALNMLIKIEKQQYYITHRRPPSQRIKQSKPTQPETPSIIPFSTTPPETTAPKNEAVPASATISHSSPPPNPENCHAKKFGYPSAACMECVNGACASYASLAPSA